MTDRRIANLETAERIWAVAAIHGEAGRLARLHDQLWQRLGRGDRVVYLGNMIGRGESIVASVDELVDFRRAVMARPGGFACHLVYLRGSQEVMWQKLLQLQFTPDPVGALSWMLQRGVSATLEAYGADAEAGIRAARAGTVALTRWTSGVRQAMQRHPGHVELLGRMHSAAQTGENGVLFVNAGLDPHKPLAEQGDLFWWHGAGFSELDRPYAGFQRVVRGFDPRRRGPEELPHKLTLDAGAGFGGPVVAACFDRAGQVIEHLEA
jgi:serine/threonine protein phosphatase 1